MATANVPVRVVDTLDDSTLDTSLLEEIGERAHYAACLTVALERSEDENSQWSNPENPNDPKHSIQQRLP